MEETQDLVSLCLNVPHRVIDRFDLDQNAQVFEIPQ